MRPLDINSTGLRLHLHSSSEYKIHLLSDIISKSLTHIGLCAHCRLYYKNESQELRVEKKQYIPCYAFLLHRLTTLNTQLFYYYYNYYYRFTFYKHYLHMCLRVVFVQNN